MKRQAGSDAGPLAIEGVIGGVPIPISGSISGGNAAASATGSAVPADADYQGVNVGGTLRGVTGVNPTGSVFAEQVDIASVGGNAVTTTIPVSGTVTAVTGGLTDTQLRATPVPVSGTVTASGPLTDTQLRATPVPISGTVTATTGGLTDTELRATPVPVSGTIGAVTAITNALPAGTNVIGNVKDAGYQNTTWAVHHLPSSNTVATITQSSAGGSLKNVCLGLTVTLAATATAPAAVQTSVSLIDGSTGGTTYLWRTVISLPAVAGAITSFNIKTPHGFEGTAATAMTLEFIAAGGANTVESVSMYGTTRL